MQTPHALALLVRIVLLTFFKASHFSWILVVSPQHSGRRNRDRQTSFRGGRYPVEETGSHPPQKRITQTVTKSIPLIPELLDVSKVNQRGTCTVGGGHFIIAAAAAAAVGDALDYICYTLMPYGPQEYLRSGCVLARIRQTCETSTSIINSQTQPPLTPVKTHMEPTLPLCNAALIHLHLLHNVSVWRKKYTAPE